jgi:hypothetical protein
VDEILRGDLVIDGTTNTVNTYDVFYKTCFQYDILGDMDRTRALLQNELISLDLLGANIERAIDRAVALALTPSVFNVGNFIWIGVQQPRRIWEGIADRKPIDDDEVGYSHGLAMVDNIQQAANVLGIALPDYLPYNKTSNPTTDESALVECRIEASNVGSVPIFLQQCAPNVMSTETFMNLYGDRLEE